jgi:hypothetical protein
MARCKAGTGSNFAAFAKFGACARFALYEILLRAIGAAVHWRPAALYSFTADFQICTLLTKAVLEPRTLAFPAAR